MNEHIKKYPNHLIARDRLYVISKELDNPNHLADPEIIQAEKNINIWRYLSDFQNNKDLAPIHESTLHVFLNEKLHTFSLNKFKLILPQPSKPDERFNISANLKNLRSVSRINNSLQLINLLKPCELLQFNDKDFFPRTNEELNLIFHQAEKFYKSGEKLIANNYLKTIDTLIIDRFIENAANNTLPPESDVRIDSGGKVILIYVSSANHSSKTHQIEGLGSTRYGDERNQKLEESLRKLGKKIYRRF